MKLQEWETCKEINQQPEVWRGWAKEFGARVEQLRGWIAQQHADEIWLCGAGTSAYVGDLIAAHLGADARRIRAISTTDLVSAPQNFIREGGRPLVISFGRSGNSTETIGTLDILDQFLPDAPRINITCNIKSALATRPSKGPQQAIILPPQCHDKGFAMTSSYTTMLLSALLLLDEATKPEDLSKLADDAETMLPKLFTFAANLQRPARAVFTGTGALTFAAREAALKVMELAAGDIPSIWDSNLGFRHGPKSFVNSETRVFVFLSGYTFSGQYDRDLAAEVRDQFGPDSVTTLGSHEADITIPEQRNDALAAVLYVLVAQVLASVWSHDLGLNVDNPFEGRGTLTRVVSGVKLYTPEGHL